MWSYNQSEGQRARTFIDEARRKQLVAVTIDTLAEVGFARTSLAEIAKRAGVSKGVISYHFAGKNELIEQVIASVYTDEASFIDDLLKQEGSAFSKLKLYLEGSVGFLVAERKLLQALTEIFLNYRKPDGSLFYDGSSDEPMVAALEAILRKGQEDGDFCEFEPRVVALTMKSTIDTLPMHMALHPEMDMEAYAEQLVALFDRATRR